MSGLDDLLSVLDPELQQNLQQELMSLDRPTLDAMNARWAWLQKARPAQLPPEDYFVWLLLAGRGTGKTRSGAEDVWWTASRETQRIAVIGPTLADVRKTCFEGESGLQAVIPESMVKGYNRSLCEMWLINDSYFVGYSSEEPDRLRGPQHHRAWCEEMASWRYLEETWDMMMFGLRLGRRPNVVVTTTPKPVGLLRKLLLERDTKISRESTFANAANLPESTLAKLREKYDGTRLGRQELYAEILDDNPFAFWNAGMLDKTRVPDGPKNPSPDYERLVVAVDPPVTTGEDADECGIVGAGRYSGPDTAKHMDVLADWSVKGRTPHGWASRAVSLYHDFKRRGMEPDCIVAETNNGGDMVVAMIHNVDAAVPVKKVTATRGKVVRTEPVSMLWEQGRAHLVGHLAELEDQMCDFTSDFDKDKMGYSPDRVDALVWAGTELMGDALQYGMLGAV